MHPSTVHVRRADRDLGSTSLTTVLLTPVFVVVAFMAFQAALWSHARTEARVIARTSAALVARSHADPYDAARSATATLSADTDLTAPAVTVDVADGLVVARVSGRAPGIVRGTSTGIDIVEVVPLEGFRP
jgi:hypothetical protein